MTGWHMELLARAAAWIEALSVMTTHARASTA